MKLLSDGTGKFIKKFKPSAIAPESAKDLMLKDSEYSTPEDHYFAHIQSKKQLELEQEADYESIKKKSELAVMRELFDSDDETAQFEVIIEDVIE